MVPTAAARGIDLHLSPAPPVDVEGDVRRLEQVFFNLIDNALKFTPKGGRVSLDMRIVDGLVEVQVADTGAGIDAEFLPLVFDRFRQAGQHDQPRARRPWAGTVDCEAAGGGAQEAPSQRTAPARATGRRLHRAHARGGEPCVRRDQLSKPGRRCAAVRLWRRPAETRLDGLRVLVVDDEADAREVMAQTLETYGASVELAGDRARSAGDPRSTCASTCCWPTSRCPMRMGSRSSATFARRPVPGVSTIPRRSRDRVHA